MRIIRDVHNSSCGVDPQRLTVELKSRDVQLRREAVTLPDSTKRERTSISEMRVTQLAEGPLDPALFTVPTGFRQVEHIEHNPPANLPSQWSIAWDHFKAGVARLFR